MNLIKKYKEKDGHLYFDFFIKDKFLYNTYFDINIQDEFSLGEINVDRGWIDLIATTTSSFSLLIFDTWPIPDNIIESMNFIGGHLYTDFRRFDVNLCKRREDLLYFYETGFNLKSLRLRRLGKLSELKCQVRVKMIWRKI